jgi:hypothetical protein
VVVMGAIEDLKVNYYLVDADLIQLDRCDPCGLFSPTPGIGESHFIGLRQISIVTFALVRTRML